jgi:Tol biopolymer transport system component
VRLKQPESFASGAFAWSPDGRYVYFPQRVGSATELFRIPTVGGRIESTGLRAPAIKYVSVHPDGKRVAFQDGDQHNVELWALDGFLSR